MKNSGEHKNAANELTVPSALEMLPLFLDIGGAMLFAGADVCLVEKSLNRLGRAYGAARTNVLVITAVIIVTFTMPDGEEVTQTRRIDTKGDTNFDKLEALNALCESCCSRPYSADELRKELDIVLKKPFPRSALYLGGILAAGSFAVFFGGSLIDGFVSAVFAVVICLLIETLKPFTPNNIIFNFIASFIAGLGIGIVSNLVPSVQTDMVMIGDIMVLIPGVVMTNAARDMIAGDTISGVMRFIESLLWATALALGFMLSMWLTRVGV